MQPISFPDSVRWQSVCQSCTRHSNTTLRTLKGLIRQTLKGLIRQTLKGLIMQALKGLIRQAGPQPGLFLAVTV